MYDNNYIKILSMYYFYLQSPQRPTQRHFNIPPPPKRFVNPEHLNSSFIVIGSQPQAEDKINEDDGNWNDKGFSSLLSGHDVKLT